MKAKKVIGGVFKGIGLIALVLCAVFCGKLLGDTFVSSFLGGDPYANLTEEILVDDVEKIMQDYNAGVITYDNLTDKMAAQAYAIATSKTKSLDFFKSRSRGVIKNSVTNQSVDATFTKDNNICTSLELSTGFKSVANKAVYDKTKDSVKLYKGKVNPDGESGTFGNDFKEFTFSEYKENYGTDASSFIAHLISSKTIKSSKMVKNENSKTFELELDTIKSTIGYSKMISVNSGMSRPEFKHINFKFEIDKDFKFVSYSVREEYYMKLGISVLCSSGVDAVFTYER